MQSRRHSTRSSIPAASKPDLRFETLAKLMPVNPPGEFVLLTEVRPGRYTLELGSLENLCAKEVEAIATFMNANKFWESDRFCSIEPESAHRKQLARIRKA